MARYVHNDRLVDALRAQAFAAMSTSPGARAFYDAQRANGRGHHDASDAWPTGSSASCTAASKPAPSTTRQPPGDTGKTSKPLDTVTPWDVFA